MTLPPSRSPAGTESDPLGLTWAVACMRTGVVLGQVGDTPPSAALENLAATLPALFDSAGRGWLERIAVHLGAEPAGAVLGEVLLLSPQHVHVVEPLTHHPQTALLAVSPTPSSVGLVLSAVHARVATLERRE